MEILIFHFRKKKIQSFYLSFFLFFFLTEYLGVSTDLVEHIYFKYCCETFHKPHFGYYLLKLENSQMKLPLPLLKVFVLYFVIGKNHYSSWSFFLQMHLLLLSFLILYFILTHGLNILNMCTSVIGQFDENIVLWSLRHC